MADVTREDDITVLNLSVRSQNGLRRVDVHTVGAVLDYPADALAHIYGMGKKSVDEIQEVVRSLRDGTGQFVLVEAKNVQPLEDGHMTVGLDGSITVYLDEMGSAVQDVLIADLPLTVRSKNSLVHNGYIYASQLVGVTQEKLQSLQGMGKKSVEEVFAYTKRITVSRMDYSAMENSMKPSDDLLTELWTAYGDSEGAWLRELMETRKKYPEATGETLIYRLYDSPFVRGMVKASILRVMEGHNDKIAKATLESCLPLHLRNTTILEEILIELESTRNVEIHEDTIHRRYLSVVEFAEQLQDECVRNVIQGRIQGKTLQEIGDQYGFTRERARQRMQKGLRNRPRLREDNYLYLYDHYDFTQEDFMLAYDEPSETYYYLEMISQVTRAKRKPLEEILTDTAIAPELRKKAERAIYKQYVSTDGVRIKMTRPHLVGHYIKINCKSLTKFEYFVSEYNRWLDSLGLGENPSLIIEARTYENILNQCDYVLWNQGRSFRYYNIPEHDFDELLSSLDLEQYVDTELSTLKLFRDYPDLMQLYALTV